MSEQTYTSRRTERVTITKRDDQDDTIFLQAGSCGFGVPKTGPTDTIQVGSTYILETRNFSIVTGLATTGDFWLFRKSDQDLDREHAEMCARFERESVERLAKNREDWTRREAALPDWLRERLARFRAAGGDRFERDGWGYELTVCELAVLYERSGGENSDEVNAYAEQHGTSGNQHGCAKALVKLREQIAEGITPPRFMQQFPAALSPLTGSADYSEATR